MNTTNKCTVAIVGAGYMAREHISAFQDIVDVEIVGINSRTRLRADTLASEFDIPYVYNSIPDLYEQTRADLVVVTVPELSANAVSRACFEHPWTVLLEKPAGYNLQDAEDIMSVAEAKNARAFVALNRRHYSSTQVVLDDIASVDGPRWIHVQDQEDQKGALKFGQPQTIVDFWMYANSIHVIDYFKMFGRGKVVSVEPVIPWQAQSPWIVAAKIVFDSGDIGFYEGIWDGPGPWAVSISTPEKRWEMRPLEQANCQSAGERKLEPMQLHEWDQKFKPGLRLQAQEAVAAVRGQKTSLPSLRDAFATMELVEAIFQL
ncbi:MAG: Gfo/Idh/MocA family oxidoreductase [Candidatus Brocadiales bacterium]|nr:Gfo/Idh/MocA family oxidoreductase [Candidatus Brocadiales bacterium]